MKCLDQNGVKYLWNCIFNNAVSKSDVDLSANVNSLNPISNNAVCNHVGAIEDSLRNSKADYEEGTWTPIVYKGTPKVDITSHCMVKGSYYFRVGKWVYITTTISGGGVNYLPDSVAGLPFTIEGCFTPSWTCGFIVVGDGEDGVRSCALSTSKSTMIKLTQPTCDFTLSGWGKIVQ